MRSSGLRTLLASPFLVRRLPAASRPSVLLTFDDGPNPDLTDQVLQRLDAHGARAVFCLVGTRVREAPDATRRLAEAGHALGNHSHEHGMASWPSLGTYLADLDRCSEAIEDAAGRAPTVFRAPGGRIHWASLVAPRRRRLPHLHWSLDPRDYACRNLDDAAELGRGLADAVRPRDIVLLHDDHPRILPLLDELLPRLVQAGFDLSAGPSLLGLTGGAP